MSNGVIRRSVIFKVKRLLLLLDVLQVAARCLARETTAESSTSVIFYLYGINLPTRPMQPDIF